MDKILKYIMFSCDSCLKQFSTKESRRSHVYKFHRKVMPGKHTSVDDDRHVLLPTGSTGDVDNFMLVSTNGDNAAQQIQLPKGLYVAGKSSTPFQCSAKEVDENEDIKEKSIEKTKIWRGKPLRRELIKYTIDKTLANQLYRFLCYHRFNVDKNGDLVFRGEKYPVNLEDHFMDLVDGNGKRLDGYEILYPLLKNCGLQHVSRFRKRYFL